MRCLASSCKSRFHQATFLAVFNLQWTLVVRNSKEVGNLFDILIITLRVQNLACIKFGDWQKLDFWRGLNLANRKTERITKIFFAPFIWPGFNFANGELSHI